MFFMLFIIDLEYMLLSVQILFNTLWVSIKLNVTTKIMLIISEYIREYMPKFKWAKKMIDSSLTQTPKVVLIKHHFALLAANRKLVNGLSK